jgi:hypothetical protein
MVVFALKLTLMGLDYIIMNYILFKIYRLLIPVIFISTPEREICHLVACISSLSMSQNCDARICSGI